MKDFTIIYILLLPNKNHNHRTWRKANPLSPTRQQLITIILFYWYREEEVHAWSNKININSLLLFLHRVTLLHVKHLY